MFDVKYIYLLFKVDKCSDLWADGSPSASVNELAGRSVSVVADEVVVGWPVSVEGLPSDVGCSISTVATVDDDRDQTEYSKLETAYFITHVPPLGQRPGISSSGFPWVIGFSNTVGVEFPHRVTGDIRLD